ncbi:MAG TPA: nuclear transport factor 2 family protein [Pseudonocardia sp.]|uniref:nuclear transport factor 2 family protein n=1 Tax=Pseudonocardia sp. TaxID=60912 RepID=UPI002C44B34B|nr:nuclear transport factor 2 family protein [Pseudonocardia sp.]HTF51658.1 nuclear transport factor 2 family protein [Pseudonocardia sp.]
MTASEDIVAQIHQLEDQRFNAVVAGDWDAFEDLCDPELVYTHSNGVVDTRDEYLKKCREGFYVYHRAEHPIDRVIVISPDTAIAVGQMNADITSNGADRQLRSNTIAVWTRRPEGWRLVAHQSTARA